MLGLERITFDTNVMGGRPCIRGMRVTVSLVLNLVASGMSTEITDAYPYLEPRRHRPGFAICRMVGRRVCASVGRRVGVRFLPARK